MIATIKVKNFGEIKVELDAKAAPHTVENFERLVENKFVSEKSNTERSTLGILSGFPPFGATTTCTIGSITCVAHSPAFAKG